MPREGVPYPGREICSLKCQIDALNAKINELMKSINGVQGDGQGNLSLISGDPAVVINNDASQNQIEIALDPSELPNAPVRSVNGLTGDVQLTAGNIPMYSGQPMSVQNQVAANEGMISILQSNLNQEVLDRGNADSALQTNVNGIGARVSVIEGQISEDPDPNTIGLRGATGRLKAEDPASGATDKTLVTANWVSQTGDSAPNNLLHKSGNESSNGEKIFNGGYRGMRGFMIRSSAGTYLKFAEFDGNVSGSGSIVFIMASRGSMGMFRTNINLDSGTHQPTVTTSEKIITVENTIKIGIDYDADTNKYRVFYAPVTNNVSIHLDVMHTTLGTGNNLPITLLPLSSATPSALFSEALI